MHPDDSFLQPAEVGYYRAPENTGTVNSQTIPDGLEYVELITAGGVFFEGEYYTAGTLFWHLPGENTVCRYRKQAPYECLVVRFFTAHPHRRIAPRVTLFRNPAEALSLSSEFLHAYHEGTFDLMLLTKVLHSRLLWESCCYARTPAISYTLPRSLKKALDWISKHFAEEITVPALASVCGISAPRLYQMFREHLNESPHQYLLAKRLQEARNRLAMTNDSLKVLSEECGFLNLEHFCRIFKSKFGVTPSEYRAKTEIRIPRS